MHNLALSKLAAKPLSRDRQTLSRRAPSQDNPHPRFGPAYASGANRNKRKSLLEGARESPQRESNEGAITKGKEKKRHRIRQDPSTPSSSYSQTDLERLDPNVSSRDGLRKPLLASSKHKCLLPESSHNKGKKREQRGTASLRTLGTGGPAHTNTENTLPEAPPIPRDLSIPSLSEGVPRQANNHQPLTPNLTTLS